MGVYPLNLSSQGGRGRWISEFEVSLVYRVNSRQPCLKNQPLPLTTENQNNNNNKNTTTTTNNKILGVVVSAGR